MPTFYEDEAIAFDAGVGDTAPYNYWVSVASRRLGQSAVTRGRQYELDIVQTGEYSPTYDNRDGALSPKNTASPYYPHVVPFRPLRKRIQFPATANMLTPNQASAGEAITVTGIDAPVAPGGTVPQIASSVVTPVVTASATAFEGAQVFQSSIPGSTATNSSLLWVFGATVVPSGPHSFSVYVRTPTGSSAVSVQLAMIWIGVGPVEISRVTSSATSLPVASNTWTRLTVSGTAPANADGVYFAVITTNSPAAGYLFQADGLQLEYAATPTAWVKPGTWYPVFSGWIERWPLQWEYNGLWGKTQPHVIDSFGYLSQLNLKPPVYADMLAMGPTFLYTFDQGKGAQYVTDLTHNNLPAPVTSSVYGPGSLTFGNTVQATTKPTTANPAGGGFLGGSSTVATFANVDSGGSQETATYVDLSANGGPKVGGSGLYTRFVAFRASAPPTSSFPHLWSWNSASFTPPYGGSNAFGFYQTTGVPAFLAGGFGNVVTGVSNGCDGDWHLWGVIVNPSAGTVQNIWDGNIYGAVTGLTGMAFTKLGGDAIGANIVAGTNTVGAAWAGDVAFIAEFPFVVSNAQAAQLYTSFRNAYSGESSASRYSRILGYANYTGASNITTTAQTTGMGPASDITQGGQQATIYAPVTGIDVQTALQNVVTTENGNHFAAADGTITFQSRFSRYGLPTPSIVFGENTAGGELSYDDIAFDFDTTHVANDAQVTQFWNSTVFEAFNTASSAQIGSKTLTRTINAIDALQCNDAASYLAYRYGNADLRLKKLRVHVTANPGQWAKLFSLELGVRCRVMRRDLSGTIQWDGFLEKLTWSFDYTTNDIFLDIEASPADLSVFWIMAAWHTTLASSVTVTAMNSNTGFESGVSPWTVSNGTITQSQLQVHSGSYAARMVPTGGFVNTYIISEQIAVTPGTTYAAKAWVWFTNTVTGTYFTGIAWFDSSHAYISTSGTHINVSAQTWTLAPTSAVAPAGAAYGSVQLVLDGTPSAGQVWYADDVALTNAVTSITLNPIGASSTLPVGAYIPNNGTGSSNTVQVGSYTTGVGTVAAPTIRLGAGTGTYEEVAVASYTCTGGSPVTNYAGTTVPGQFTGYSSVTVALASPLINSYASGVTVSEALPAAMTDPTAHDVDSALGTSTIIAY